MANKVGKYGAHEYDGDDCRICFTIDLAARIKHAVEVEMKLGTWALLLAVSLSASPITHMPNTEPPLQYWHTQWVPTDNGVYPQEVYAPALPRVEPELYVFVDIGDPPRLETPEPEMWTAFPIGIVGGIVLAVWSRRAKIKRRRLLLEAIRKLEPNASTLEIGREVEGGIQLGGIYIELDSMHRDGILTMRTEPGGPERGFRDRAFYSIARKALEE